MASTEAEVLRSLILVLNEIYLTYDFKMCQKTKPASLPENT